jgi:Na+-translocating ferredoxin:NAD+ oxidoreductase subunit G
MNVHSSAPDASARHVYGVLVGIALAAGLVIATVQETTGPRVAAQRAAVTARAVQDVLPGTAGWIAYALQPDGRLVALPTAATHVDLFAAYDANDTLIGYAIPAHGMGYQDRIGLLYGVDPDLMTLLGLSVLDSRETPGLGARIADDDRFLRGFRGLDIRGDQHPLRISLGSGTRSGHIDAITGATVSSRAVVDIVNDSLRNWWPRLTTAAERRERDDG